MNNLKEFEYDYFGEEDIDIVLDIERQSNPYPWTINNFKDCIRRLTGFESTYNNRVNL